MTNAARGDAPALETRPGIEAPEHLRPRLGISGCLLGEAIRLNGGHCRNAFLVDRLGPFVEWCSVCPEVESGMSVPRPPIRLVRDERDAHRMVIPETGEDITDRMTAFNRKRAGELAGARLDGFVLKKDSPSCGIERVKVYDRNGSPSRIGQGFFPRALGEAMPHLPMEEEGRLNDAVLREHFVLRLYTQARWRSLLENEPTPGALVRFHAAHKMLLLAHSPSLYGALGRLVAEAGTRPWDELAADYGQLLAEALSERSRRGRHVNAIQHLMGFVRDRLPEGTKGEMATLLDRYRAGLVPLVVPLTLLEHHLRSYRPHAWAERQLYLRPYPEELMLRND